MTDVTLALMTAILGGSSLAALLETYRWWQDKNKNKLTNFDILLNKVHKVYTTIDELRKELGCDRILILRAHNGGGLPSPDNNLYSSIIYESSSKEVGNVKDTWQRQRIDKTYANLLLEVYKNGKAVIVTEDHPESILKNVYTAQKVATGFVFKISTKHNRFMYLSIHFANQVDSLSPEEQDHIRIALNTLTDIFDNTKDI